MEPVCIRIPKHVGPMQNKKYEHARQDEKHVLDPLEAIMRPTDPVKEELRPNLFKMSQFGSKIQKARLQRFGFQKSKVFPLEANASLLTSKF